MAAYYCNLAEREALRADRLAALLAEVGHSGVEHDDPRIDYVTVQVDRSTWEQIRKPDLAVGS